MQKLAVAVENCPQESSTKTHERNPCRQISCGSLPGADISAVCANQAQLPCFHWQRLPATHPVPEKIQPERQEKIGLKEISHPSIKLALGSPLKRKGCAERDGKKEYAFVDHGHEAPA